MKEVTRLTTHNLIRSHCHVEPLQQRQREKANRSVAMAAGSSSKRRTLVVLHVHVAKPTGTCSLQINSGRLFDKKL